MFKERPSLHKRAYPYFLFILGLLVGIAIAIDWDIKISDIWDESFNITFGTEKSIWDIFASIGSLLAGIGTIGLLIFGLIKANEWIKQVRTQAKINLTIKTAERFASEVSSLSLFININMIGKSQLDLSLEGDNSRAGHSSLSKA